MKFLNHLKYPIRLICEIWKKKIGRLYLHALKNMQWKDGLNKNQTRNQRVIVSLTSFPARFDILPLTLKSLMYQTVQPDKIIVWIDEFVDDDLYTGEMVQAQELGIELVKIPNDLKPHKKYFFAMQKYPDDIIITVDDDVVYWPNMIASLLRTHKKFPYAVCARRVHYITYEGRKLQSYNQWIKEYHKIVERPTHQLIAVGVGGVLYPPQSLSKETFNIEKIKENCYLADDIWLKFMEFYSGVPVMWTKCIMRHPIEIIEEQEIALCNENVLEGRNDKYIKRMLGLLNFEEDCFKNN